MSTRKIMISAGEASGDANAAALVSSLKSLDGGLSFSGMGGPALAGAGMDVLVDYKAVNVVGLMEVLPKLAGIFKASRKLKKVLREAGPEALIVVDLPDFNFNLARAAKAAGVPVFWYIAPQVWAWRKGRINKMRRLTRLVISILPFEKDWFQEQKVDVFYAGHPMVDRPVPTPEQEAGFRREHGLAQGQPILALLPGSRGGEIRKLLPIMVQTADMIRRERPETAFVAPVAPGREKEELAALCRGVDILLSHSPAREVVSYARAALVCSGTATLETAMAGTPMVVVYKGNPVSYLIGRAIIRGDKHLIALPNLVAADFVHNRPQGEFVVPVLLQGQVEPRRLSKMMIELVDDTPARQKMMTGLAEIKRRMGEPGSAKRAAAKIMEVMNNA